jgi:phosphatidylserine decarboxylase
MDDKMRRTLIFQLLIIALGVASVFEFAVNFPYPSPLIKFLLPPKLRWPTEQVQGWVEAQNFPAAFLEFFARDPERTIPDGANLVAPADGAIVYELHSDGVSYLVIGMSFWDVHVIRAPVAGVVAAVEEEGVRLVREKVSPDRAVQELLIRGKDAPVQKIVTIRTDSGDLRVRMITSYWASRLKVWVSPGQKLTKGERIGRILLGSTAVLDVPRNIHFTVEPRQRVTGGETIVYNEKE